MRQHLHAAGSLQQILQLLPRQRLIVDDHNAQRHAFSLLYDTAAATGSSICSDWFSSRNGRKQARQRASYSPAAPTTTSSCDCPSRCVWIAGAPHTMHTAESFVTSSAIAISAGIGPNGSAVNVVSSPAISDPLAQVHQLHRQRNDAVVEELRLVDPHHFDLVQLRRERLAQAFHVRHRQASCVCDECDAMAVRW